MVLLPSHRGTPGAVLAQCCILDCKLVKVRNHICLGSPHERTCAMGIFEGLLAASAHFPPPTFNPQLLGHCC